MRPLPRAWLGVLGLVLAGCGPSYPEHCDVGDAACARDPARARTAEASCAVGWTEDHAFQCQTALAGGEPFDIRWEIHHPRPPTPGLINCENEWVDGESYPLALVTHGGGSFQSHETYSYLLEHLSLNDFIAVSVSTRGGDAGTNNAPPSQRAEIMDAFLQCLASDDPSNFVGSRWNGELALLGHSRGGEAVVQLAPTVEKSVPGVELQAVVALGPALEEGTVPAGSDAEPACRAPAVDGTATPAFLVINGSHG